jgi:hypothetical protein
MMQDRLIAWLEREAAVRERPDIVDPKRMAGAG